MQADHLERRQPQSLPRRRPVRLEEDHREGYPAYEPVTPRPVDVQMRAPRFRDAFFYVED